MMKLALVQPSRVKDWEPDFLSRVKKELSQPRPNAKFQLVDHAEDADAVFHVDSIFHKSSNDVGVYQKLLEWADENNKLAFSLSFEDLPLGALPGIYTSLESGNFDPTLHLSWPHLEAPNKGAETTPKEPPKQDSYLFTFAGSCSHRLRSKLFSIYSSEEQNRWKVHEVKRWYNHTTDERETYIDDIINSHFVLCPRGIASYSHRILETMLLERIPVIIADDWVPFSFAEQNYYISIPEKDVANIASILERELKNYDLYLSNLRKVNERWLTEKNRYCNVVERFLEFHQQHQSVHHPKALLERLKSTEFRRSNGLLSHQKILKSANAIPRQGKKMFEKLISRCSQRFASQPAAQASEPCTSDKNH